ncbi:DUF5937 family protein [Brevibacillus sp. GCM10020057]|uniref:DUF5937 family protein n=1 Tax=Brevibacillus sp. GCM10020057 TaxID=3317327 RepID=UPI00363FDD9C
MMTISLPISGPLSHVISYSVSPLYELAASLHTLAQPSPPALFADWVDGKLSTLRAARLLKDWEYLLPLFRYGIPDSFDPLQTKGVMAVDDQYEYFVTLPTETFVRSLLPQLEAWKEHHPAPPIAADLREDTDYVKGRFSLFISSYWQLSFENNWEGIAPLFVAEAEKIHNAVQSKERLLAYLQTLLPEIRYDAETNSFSCPAPGPDCEAQHLILYPSHYYFSAPTLTKKGMNAHLLYSFVSPFPSTKNAL